MNDGEVAPVRVGDELQVMIDAVGAKGDGIARVKGFVLFVPGTRQGDSVRVKITRVLRNVGFADVLRKEQPAEGEAVPQPEPVQTYEDTENFGEE